MDRVIVSIKDPRGVIPDRIEGYRCTHCGRPEKSVYRRSRTYTSPDASAPMIVILYSPKEPFFPRFQVHLFAQKQLLHPTHIEEAVRRLGLLDYARLSLIELTLDLPPEWLHAIRDQFCPRWVTRVRDYRSTRYWARRMSSRQYRCYPKDDGDLVAARLECVLRRSSFRRHVNMVTDLYRPEWVTAVQRCMRFLTFEPAWSEPLASRCRALSAIRGVLWCLRQSPPLYRRAAQLHLQPAPIGTRIDTLFEQFRHSLAGPHAIDLRSRAL